MWSPPTSLCRTKACSREWFPWESKFLDRPHDPSAGTGGASVYFPTASLVARVADIVLTRASARCQDKNGSGWVVRLCRDRAEELRSIHDPRPGEAGGGERLGNPLLRLTGVDREAERHDATGLEHAPYLLQPGARIRPRLHRIDRERLVECPVGERQPFRRAVAQVGPAVAQGVGIAGRGLADHFL